MEHSLRLGLSFGLTSAVITTLGLVVGLDASTHSRAVVLGGILTIAFADAFSDALGIHMSEESENVHSPAEIWTSTAVTFLAKLTFALTFAVPVVLLPLSTAIMVSLAWGLGLLTILSYAIARHQGERPWNVVVEHVLVALAVVAVTHLVGHWISGFEV